MTRCYAILCPCCSGQKEHELWLRSGLASGPFVRRGCVACSGSGLASDYRGDDCECEEIA